MNPLLFIMMVFGCLFLIISVSMFFLVIVVTIQHIFGGYHAFVIKTGKRTMLFDYGFYENCPYYCEYPNFVVLIKNSWYITDDDNIYLYQTKENVLTRQTKLYHAQFGNINSGRVCMGSSFRNQFSFSKKSIRNEIVHHLLSSVWEGFRFGARQCGCSNPKHNDDLFLKTCPQCDQEFTHKWNRHAYGNLENLEREIGRIKIVE